MDDAWRSKCSSAWQPPPPPPEAAAAAGTGMAPPVTENQMDMNFCRPIHPFILQGTKHKDHPTVQEPLVLHTLNLDSAKSGKAELSNSFRALLSGHSHFTNDFSQLPNMKSVLSKLHVPNGEADVSGSNLCVPVTNIPYLSENHDGVRMSNTDVSSFVVKNRPSLVSTSTKIPDWCSSLQISTSHCHGSRAAKPGSNQSFQGSSTGMVVSSINCGRPIATSPGDTSQYHALNIHAPRTKPIEPRSSAPGHDSACFRGRPRVFCMNAVGVLFLSDMGLLGVLCFCHSLQMSLAKFCEHSGPSSVNPGVAVRLENGMTVARWRRLCFGNNAPDDDKGWDWPDILKEKAVLVGSKGIGFPSSSKAPETIDFGGSGKSGKGWSKSIHSNHTHPGVGQTAFKSWSNTSMDNMHQHNRLEGYNHIFNSFPSSSQIPLPPAVVHNNTVQAGKESHHCLHKASQSVLSIKRSLGHEHYIRGSTASEAYVMAGDGSSSNVDLSLGQPSQATHASVMSFPTTMKRVQLGPVHTSPKARVILPLSESTDYPRLTKKARQTIQTAQMDAPSSSRAQTAGSNNAFNHSEPKELTADATKSSLVSLFLSHLNTEGNSSCQSAGIVNSKRHLMTRSLDVDSVSGNCNPAQSITNINNRYEQKYVKDGYELSNNMDKVKGLGLMDNKSCNIVKGSYVVHNIQTTDTRIPKPATGEHFVNRVFSVDAVKPSGHINRGSSIFQNVADSTSNQSGEVPSLRNKEHHDYAIYCSTNPQSHAISRSGFLNPGISEALTTESLNNAEPTLVLPHNRSADLSQHKVDENIRHLALRHMVELKQDQSSVTCKTSPRLQSLCCQKTMELQRMSCNSVLASSEDSRQGSYCDVQKGSSRFAHRPVPACSNCYSSARAEMLASKPGTRGNECCNCSAVTQRMPQFSTCHVCGAEEHSCLRLGRTSNSRSDGIKQMNSQKEHSPSISRNSYCTVHSKSLTGCCFLGGDNMPSGYINEHDVCGKARTVHIAQSCDKNHTFQDVKNFKLGQCECSKKKIVIKNDVQNGRWRDVPTKLIGNCNGTLGDKHEEVLEASSVATNQYLGTTLKESDEAHQTTESRNERQMSNNCSGSSAPAVTEISVEFNNTNFSVTNIEDTKMAYDPLVDEASGIEKYGSSDEELGSSGCDELIVVSDKMFPRQVDCLPCHSSGKPITNLRAEIPANKTRVGNQGYASRGAEANIKQIEPIEEVFKSEKRGETMKMNKLNIPAQKSDFYPINSISSYCKSTWDSSSPKKCEALQSDNEDSKLCHFPIRSSSVKRKRSALFTSKSLSLNSENHDNLSKSDRIQSLTVSAEKEAKAVSLEKNIAKQKGIHSDTGKPPKYMSLSSIGNSCRSEVGTTSVKVRPVVRGRSGIISNGRPSSQQKPAKLVSLSLILKKTKRCDINENGVRPNLTSKIKKPHLDANIDCCNELTFLKVQHETEDSSDVRISGVLVSDKDEQSSKKNDWCSDEFPTTESKSGDESDRVEKPSLNHEHRTSQTKLRFKEARRCSLSELIDKNKFATEHLYTQKIGDSHSSDLIVEPKMSLSTMTGTECHCPESSIPKSSLSNNINLEKHSHKSQYHAGALCQTNTQRSSKTRNCQPFPLKSDAFCSVCGSSDKEKANYLLECNRCFIRVHQACYGVSRVPKGHWLCRPCKTNSRNIVCVLCGYEGGAMTRAVKNQTIVKSLLKVWNVGIKSNNLEPDTSSETDKNELLHTRSIGEASKVNSCSVTDVTSPICEAVPETAYYISSSQTSIIGHSETVSKYIEMNSITAGVLDPSVIQWVHMVCGLWTPGTRCLNVDTMGVFDVSGASATRKNIVCSMCNRPGGSCIQCRILNCFVHFHPWCAHQKGLLQSENEGDDNEKVGFYGRCTLHATQNGLVVDNLPVDAEVANPRKDWTCARTEGFKGHKSEEGSRPNHRRPSSDSGACIVSQEQINAWLHINGQKSCTRPLAKHPCSEVEHDFRKEYFRYKQLKAWKHLVVYKSGIHALGLYTSQLIARGAMVVEYVGEIVGLRVADKRELEYQSGRRVQYKSACYFFRIDKEHIIDATRKGGIARFVNHSCQPNCVAKVISIRNEKKVVFFAERDINPGEEITYDYHFNSEDEGQKIRCFCNSKNCRQYLN